MRAAHTTRQTVARLTVTNLLDRLGVSAEACQSRLMSLVNAVANVVVGYGVAVLVQFLLPPVFGLTVTLRQNLVIGMVFTAVSVVRSFALRRIFELWR